MRPRTVTTPTHSDALRARALPAIVILPREAHGFLARPCRDLLGVATRKPTGLPPYAPSCNCGLAARVSMFSSLAPVGVRSASLLGSPPGFLPTLRP